MPQATSLASIPLKNSKANILSNKLNQLKYLKPKLQQSQLFINIFNFERGPVNARKPENLMRVDKMEIEIN